jgi:TonB family protein
MKNGAGPISVAIALAVTACGGVPVQPEGAMQEEAQASPAPSSPRAAPVDDTPADTSDAESDAGSEASSEAAVEPIVSVGNCEPCSLLTPEQELGKKLGDSIHGGQEESSPRARIRIAVAKSEGPVTRETFIRIFHRHQNEVLFCYERWLLETGSCQGGSISVQLVVENTGTVLSSDIVDSSFKTPALESCVSAAVKRWSFPRPENGLTATTTIRLKMCPPAPPASES